MKIAIATFMQLISSFNSYSSENCTNNIDSLLKSWAPNTNTVVIKGKYTEKSSSGVYKDCSLSIKLEGTFLRPDFYAPFSFDLTHGDGGAFWPFGEYPTVKNEEYSDRRLISYSCNSDKNGFEIDYSYRSKTGWRQKKRYSLALIKNKDETFTASLRDGITGKPAACKGTISE